MGKDKGRMTFRRNRMTIRLSDANFDYLCKRSREDGSVSLNSMLNTVVAIARRADGDSNLATIIPDPRIAHVYVLEDGSLYKIGWSANPQRRKIDLETGTPRQLEIVMTIECSFESAPKLERILHQQFSEKRVRGEWFKLEARDLEWIRANTQSLRIQAGDATMTAKHCESGFVQ